MKHDAITTFWQAYLDTLPEEERVKTYTVWAFGDNPNMANELGGLVRDGIKTATCAALWQYHTDKEPLPKVGELSIILGGDGHPLCIIETTEAVIKAFNEVDAEFAFDEGEGDRSLAYWRDAHWRFFSRTLPSIGREPDEGMPLVCERFRVVYPQEPRE